MDDSLQYLENGQIAFKPRSYDVDCAAAGKAGVSMCRQSETASTDLNVALKRYRASGVLSGTLADTRKGMFGDFSDSPDSFFDAQVAIANAQCAFAGLPARVRERFGNDPVKLLTFLADSANTDEALALGLADPAAVARNRAFEAEAKRVDGVAKPADFKPVA